MTTQVVTISRHGGPDVLHHTRRDLPPPGPGQAQVHISAFGVNRADLIQRRGFYPAPPGFPSDIPGLEISGTVTTLGEGHHDLEVGAEVMALCGGGGYADFINLHSRELMPVPRGIALEEAAAIPEVFVTAWDALSQAHLKRGDTVLIHAAASGVGTAAIQLVNLWGATPIGTCRTPEKRARLEALGLKECVVPEGKNFAAKIRELTGGRGVDVVLDLVGGDYTAESIRAMAPGGRLILIGMMGGNTTNIPLDLVLGRRLTLMGTVLRPRPVEDKIRLARAFTREWIPSFEQGLLRPVIDQVMPVKQIAEAHQLLESNNSVGKIVMSWGRG